MEAQSTGRKGAIRPSSHDGSHLSCCDLFSWQSEPRYNAYAHSILDRGNNALQRVYPARDFLSNVPDIDLAVRRTCSLVNRFRDHECDQLRSRRTSNEPDGSQVILRTNSLYPSSVQTFRVSSKSMIFTDSSLRICYERASSGTMHDTHSLETAMRFPAGSIATHRIAAPGTFATRPSSSLSLNDRTFPSSLPVNHVLPFCEAC